MTGLRSGFPHEPVNEMNTMDNVPKDATPIIVFRKTTSGLRCFTALGREVGPSPLYVGWWPMPQPITTKG